MSARAAAVCCSLGMPALRVFHGTEMRGQRLLGGSRRADEMPHLALSLLGGHHTRTCGKDGRKP